MILIETHIVDVYTNHGVVINGSSMENEYNTFIDRNKIYFHIYFSGLQFLDQFYIGLNGQR